MADFPEDEPEINTVQVPRLLLSVPLIAGRPGGAGADTADAVACLVTGDRRVAVIDMLVCAIEQIWWVSRLLI